LKNRGKSHTCISSNPSNDWIEPAGVLLEKVEVWHPKKDGVLGPLLAMTYSDLMLVSCSGWSIEICQENVKRI